MKAFKTALLACTMLAFAANAASAQKQANTLRWASDAAITTVDPYYNALREAVIINAQLVWDTLIYRNPDTGKYEPLLAKSWKWLDDSTLEFDLRDDVLFHDGRPFTSEDAVYTFNYMADATNKINVQSNVNFIKGAEALGPYKIKVMLKKAFPPALEYIAMVHAMLPKDFYGPGGVAGGNGRLVGTGPYKITRFVPADRVELELTGKYFAGSPKGQPTLQRMQYRVIPDSSTQIATLLSGSVDWIWYVPKDQAAPIAKQTGIKVLSAETMRISKLAYNLRDMPGGNPLKDIRVRQAIAHAIDRDLIVKEIIGEGATVLKTPCFRTQFGCGTEVVQFPYDPDKAKKLLAEAGYPQGFTLEVVAYRSREWTEAITGFLNAVGIKTNITQQQYASVVERVAKNQAHIFIGDWGSYSVNDVSALYNAFFSLNQDDMVHDDEVAKALVDASSTVDEAVRKAKYDFVSKRVAERLYWFPLWANPVTYAYRSDLDFKAYPDENPRFFWTKWK